MKQLLTLILLTSLFQCKFVESSTGTTDPYGPTEGPAILKESECLVNAKVLRELDSALYELRIYQVKQRSESFTQPLVPGDKIEFHTPIELEVGKSMDLKVQWLSDDSGGRFMQSSSAE